MLRFAPLARQQDAQLYLRTVEEAAGFFSADLAGRPVEELRVAHLDPQGRVLGLSGGQGSALAIELPIRLILAEALSLGARAILLAHNHPAGDPAPSPGDHRATRRLAEAALAMQMRLVDHLIFAGGRHYSFREAGLL